MELARVARSDAHLSFHVVTSALESVVGAPSKEVTQPVRSAVTLSFYVVISALESVVCAPNMDPTLTVTSNVALSSHVGIHARTNVGTHQVRIITTTSANIRDVSVVAHKTH